MRFLFASGNKGKIQEVQQALRGTAVTVVSPAEVGKGVPPEVEETGSSYRANALLKAKAYFEWSGLPTLADDTGLEVSVLNGAPGLYSARYAGEGADPKKNVAKLLFVLSERKQRIALFRCVLCFVQKSVPPLYFESTLPGTITTSPRGGGGFGYDNVFEVEGSGKTLAELKEEATKVETHRTKALQLFTAHCLRAS